MNDQNELIPFGKYKGQPVNVLQQDRNYCEWLMGQDWLQNRFPAIRTLIINNFAEPADTPEHNALQARFLDGRFNVAVMRLALPNECPATALASFVGKIPVTFEAEGADVVLGAWHGQAWLCRDNDPERFNRWYQDRAWRLAKEISALQSNEPYNWPSDVLRREDVQAALDARLDEQATLESGWIYIYLSLPNLGIEIKPTMGDDYPAVMRQIRAMGRRIDRRVLVIGAYHGVGASLDQVRAMFAASDITLLMIDEIDALAATI